MKPISVLFAFDLCIVYQPVQALDHAYRTAVAGFNVL